LAGCKFVPGARAARIVDVDRIVATTLPQLLSLFVHNKVDACQLRSVLDLIFI
jgi:hypothetical protein